MYPSAPKAPECSWRENFVYVDDYTSFSICRKMLRDNPRSVAAPFTWRSISPFLHAQIVCSSDVLAAMSVAGGSSLSVPPAPLGECWHQLTIASVYRLEFILMINRYSHQMPRRVHRRCGCMSTQPCPHTQKGLTAANIRSE